MNASDFEGIYVEPMMLKAILKLTQDVPIPEDLMVRASEICREEIVESVTSPDHSRVYGFDMSELDPSDCEVLSKVDRSHLLEAMKPFLDACYLKVNVGSDLFSRQTFWEEIFECSDLEDLPRLSDFEIKFLEIVFPSEFNSVF